MTRKETKAINVAAIVRVVSLLRTANNTGYAYVSETAREMGIRKTDLTEFILQNPKFFQTGNESKGMTIRETYEKPELNPANEEWLNATLAAWRKRLLVKQWNCYGQLEEFYVEEDEVQYCVPDKATYDRKPWLWRNTGDKMKAFIEAGHHHKGFGSLDTWSGREIPYCLKENEMKALIDEGWRLEGTIPESILKYQNTPSKI